MLIRWQREATLTDIPEIRGLPKVTESLPFMGDLRTLGVRVGLNDSSVYLRWAQELNTDLFQMRMGNERKSTETV